MTDEQHPNERLVTPSEDGEGFDRSLVSRRSMLGGSALLAGLLAYTSDPTDPQLPGRASGSAAGIARASDNPDEPLIILGPESDPVGYLFQDTAGGIILQDATSGNHFWYNQAQGRWETDAELDVPSLTTDEVVIDGQVYILDGTVDFSGGLSTTHTLSATYDQVLVLIDHFRNTHTSTQALAFRVDGDSGTNYDLKGEDGAEITGQSSWFVTSAAVPVGGEIGGKAMFAGTWNDQFQGTAMLWHPLTASYRPHVENATVSSPLDSITFRGNAGNIDVEALVLGRDVV